MKTKLYIQPNILIKTYKVNLLQLPYQLHTITIANSILVILFTFSTSDIKLPNDVAQSAVVRDVATVDKPLDITDADGIHNLPITADVSQPKKILELFIADVEADTLPS